MVQDHLDELRERVLLAALAALVSVLACFAFSRDLVVFLEAPVASQGVRFLQLSPGEFFFTTLKVTSVDAVPATSYSFTLQPLSSQMICLLILLFPCLEGFHDSNGSIHRLPLRLPNVAPFGAQRPDHASKKESV